MYYLLYNTNKQNIKNIFVLFVNFNYSNRTLLKNQEKFLCRGMIQLSNGKTFNQITKSLT